MELINQVIFQVIFVGALLVAVSILLGMISSRVGAPLLLVFLGLGMLAGEDGPGGIKFDDFRTTYLIGSIALAIILFDGGLRTPRSAFKIAMGPALSLATVSVVLTAGIAGAIASWALGIGVLPGLLVGATIASTDAAAVFLLLHARGTELSKRVSASLELESGMNDPMAIFLTIACIELLTHGAADMAAGHIVAMFLMQMVGGAVIGIVGGYILLWLINRIEIAAGLYPILAAAVALTVFAGAQLIEASGFLAIYLAGLVLGNNRHRAQQVISRFHDGLAWLSQISMFLLLGLLVSPSQLLHNWWAEIVVALALIFIARPVAVFVGLAPFRFSWRERSFIAWVGLRGAVPIFLASIPVIAGVADGMMYFNVAFVVVITSLLIQGWTVSPAARFLGLELPPTPEPADRQGIDLPLSADREAASWRVAERSRATEAPFADLTLPRRTRIIAVIRGGTVMNRETLDRLEVDDYVIALAPPQHVITLDRLFSTPLETGRRAPAELGEFVFNGDVTLGSLCSMYGLPFEPLMLSETLDQFMRMRLGGSAVVGDRVALGPVELIVRDVEKGHVARVGLEVEPAEERLPALRLLHRL
ncbi:MAG: potassium/proton antiporter, partial [Alphaproteobacteria bacterium]|nr:potassium/proton antiporter [Alphaproteobacteria bacterium]